MLEFIGSWLRLGLLIFFFGDFYLLAFSVIIIVVDFFLVLGLLPIDLLILDGSLEVGVDIWLFDLRLSLLDEERQLVIQLMDQLQHIEEL